MKLTLFFATTAVSLRVLLTQLNPPQVGILNVTTGQLVQSPAKFPLHPGCTGWNLGGNGTRGQAFTSFDVNGSWFVLAEGTGCSSAVPPTTLFDMIGPYSDGGRMSSHAVATLTTTSALADMSVSWDYTCNVVVLTRERGSTEVRFKTNQVSDYDGQQRMQPDYTTEPLECTDCWRKVGGVGGIDPGFTEKVFQKGDMEINCGDECVFYSIEEHIVDGKAVLPRALIGRSFRTGKLMVNMTDSLQIQTITMVQMSQQFLGLGRCCQESWCHSSCQGIPDQDLVLFQYVPQNRSLVLKAHLGPETGEDPSSAVRVGIEVDGFFRVTQAFVLYDGKIVSYDLKSFARNDVPLQSSQFIGGWAQTR